MIMSCGSSLDRFIKARSPLLLRQDSPSGESRLWKVAGSLQLLGGIGSLALALLPDLQPFAFIGGWLSVQGLVYLGVGRTSPGNQRDLEIPTVRLSAEAEALVRRMAAHQESTWPFRGAKSAAEVLAPPAGELLEQAAAQYNRLSGLLAGGSSVPAGVLERLTPTVRAAADEAMAEVPHLAALIQHFPESATTQSALAAAPLTGLRDLAEELEQLHLEGFPRLAPADSGVLLHQALDTLRSQRRACVELAENLQGDDVVLRQRT